VWDFRLVDPDNREPVDYEKRQVLLTWLQQAAAQKSPEELAAELKSTITDGRLKLYAVHKALELRGRHADVFSNGRYVPLRAEGEKRRNVVAFARHNGENAAIVMVGRFFMDFSVQPNAIPTWADTRIELPEFARKGVWRDIYSQRQFENPAALTMAEVFSLYPFACLERVNS
jgi:(1->4)-alpha-D-glucan 1-alpha-D-glucosylmutase